MLNKKMASNEAGKCWILPVIHEYESSSELTLKSTFRLPVLAPLVECSSKGDLYHVQLKRNFSEKA
jgi:hypothetical protein